jgi:hypothetical protein
MTTKVKAKAADVYTTNVEFTAVVYPITPVQWHIIRSTSWSSLAVGFCLGVPPAYLIPIIRATMDNVPIKDSDVSNLKLSVLAAIAIAIIGWVADGRRRRILKMLDRELLSDEKIGLK